MSLSARRRFDDTRGISVAGGRPSTFEKPSRPLSIKIDAERRSRALSRSLLLLLDRFGTKSTSACIAWSRERRYSLLPAYSSRNIISGRARGSVAVNHSARVEIKGTTNEQPGARDRVTELVRKLHGGNYRRASPPLAAADATRRNRRRRRGGRL